MCILPISVFQGNGFSVGTVKIPLLYTVGLKDTSCAFARGTINFRFQFVGQTQHQPGGVCILPISVFQGNGFSVGTFKIPVLYTVGLLKTHFGT